MEVVLAKNLGSLSVMSQGRCLFPPAFPVSHPIEKCWEMVLKRSREERTRRGDAYVFFRKEIWG